MNTKFIQFATILLITTSCTQLRIGNLTLPANDPIPNKTDGQTIQPKQQQNKCKDNEVLIKDIGCVSGSVSDMIDTEDCPKYQISTKQRGCISACSDPKYKQCADAFIQIYNPRYCGFKRDGSWVSVTFDCQACSNSYPNTQYIGVAKGKCEEDAQPIDLQINDTQTAPQPDQQCTQYQIYTKERGCISDCSDPQYQQCADAFIAIYDPQYCALKKDGTWVSLTFVCQACAKYSSNSQYVGVAQGRCEEDSQLFDIQLVNPPQMVKPSQVIEPVVPLIPIKPVVPPVLILPIKPQPQGTNGCKNYQIYTKERGCIRACSDPKFKQCGDVFIQIYNPKYCGLRKDGTWVSVTFDCQACPNTYPNTEYLGVALGKCDNANDFV